MLSCVEHEKSFITSGPVVLAEKILVIVSINTFFSKLNHYEIHFC